MTNSFLLLLCALLVGCASSHPASVVTTSNPEQADTALYERHIGVYRGFYDDLLAAPKDANTGRPYNRDLIDAVHGDAPAAHRLFHSIYRTQGGEFGEAWDRHCWVLLLKLGDEHFAKLLESEDRQTRRLVSSAVTAYMQEDFPRTTYLLRPTST